MFRLAALVQECGEKDPIIFSIVDCDQSEIVAYLEKDNELDQERDELLKTWKSTFLEENIKGYQERYENADRKFFGRSSAIAAVTGELQKFAVTSIQGDRIPSLLQPVVNYQKNIKELQIAYDQLSEEAKKILKNLQSDQEFKTICDDATTWARSFDEFPGGLDAAREITADKQRIGSVKLFLNAHDAMISAETALNQLLSRITVDHKGNWIEHEQEFCSFALKYPAALKEWGIYNHIRKECLAVGLNPVVEEYEKTRQTEGIESAYKKGLYYALINEVILNDDVLSSFSGATFNESVQQFKKIDAELLKVTRQEIYYKLASRIPSSWDSPEVAAELNLLRKAISSNARGMSIRTLFSRIPHLLPYLAPCMLMSPNSVAQYLDRQNDMFDVVIFDEASQLPTCKAVGVIARGKEAVIVGDPKQMPPTSFFTEQVSDEDDYETEDLESILDDCLAISMPEMFLSWHYRSRHESLITFSNKSFYEGRLYTFPSPDDRRSKVTTVDCGGSFDSGKTRTNKTEAQAVIDEIKMRAHDPVLSKYSVGVVTFNIQQQSLIEDLLDEAASKDPELEKWAFGSEEPVFIKNLENVQGDERDVILFSVGYGKDETGRLIMNFGPLNRDGGWRRLHVAVTRSRIEMKVFSSISPEEIRISDTSSEGVKAFKRFLQYAGGSAVWDQDIASTGSSSDNSGTPIIDRSANYTGIADDICARFKAAGYVTEKGVGKSGFKIDIGVVSPEHEGTYCLGIMLDGPVYASSGTTTSREVSQLSMLKGFGWNVVRVWSLEWWENPDSVFGKLLSLVKEQEKKDEIPPEDTGLSADTGSELKEESSSDPDGSVQEVSSDGSSAEVPEPGPTVVIYGQESGDESEEEAQKKNS